MPRKPSPSLDTLINDESKPFWDAINEQDSLACVLIAVSYIEKTLDSVLLQCLVETPKEAPNQQPVPTSAQQIVNGLGLTRKADWLFALGHLPIPIYRLTTHLARIRNHFAHNHLSASFTDKEVKSSIKNIILPKGCPAQIKPRDKFTFAAVLVAQTLQIHGLSINYPKVLEWKGLD